MLDLTHHSNLSNEDYHALKAVSPSQLKVLSTKTPAHYFDQFLAEDRVKKPPTAAMLLGTALHTAVLEPDLWDATIAVPPHAFDRRTKVGKELAAQFAAESAGKIILDPDDADNVRRMADSVRAHPAARFLLDIPGRREPSYTWTCPETGLACKTRPDWHSEDRRILCELKSSEDASRAEFMRSIHNYGYHVQAEWNRAAQGSQIHLTVVVEKVRPWAVAVYPMSDAALAAGRRRINTGMSLLAQCWASGVWPGYGDQILEPIELPRWNDD